MAYLISIIGCGRVGKTLGKLFHDHQVFSIGAILNRTLQGAKDSVAFIGAGTPTQSIDDCLDSDIILIGTPDHQIESVAQILAGKTLKSNCVVFHCSGLLTSDVLADARGVHVQVADAGGADARDVQIQQYASVHPFNSFANPEMSSRSFDLTPCAIEGSPFAMNILKPAFTKIGGAVFEIAKEKKALYHAAAAMVSNHFVALIETALTMYEQCGFERADSLKLIAPIARVTLDNILKLDTTKALTGVVSRGEVHSVSEHLKSLEHYPHLKNIYACLAKELLPLAKQQGNASDNALKEIKVLLDTN